MNKDDECRTIRHLQNLWEDFPQGEIKPLEENEEPPDFLIIGPDHQVTEAEITRFYRAKEGKNFIPAEQESLRWQVCNSLFTQLSTTGHSNLYIQILFNDHHPIKKYRIKNIAIDIFNFISQVNYYSKEKYQFRQLSWPDLIPDEVATIHLSVVESLKNKIVCFPLGTTFKPKLTPDTIQIIIDNKNYKYSIYHKSGNKAILVIEIHGFMFSSIGDLSDEVLVHEFQSPFDHVFIINDGDQLFEIKSKK
ncbi:MAG: hypothetical protein HPY72_11570 [Anaerolineae bacterium]|nr:hypothetical protein [Anaerolineae bacterium]